MFAYCNNNPVALEDISGMASKSCLYDSTEPRMPWRDSGSGGGRPYKDYSSGSNYYGKVADKFYIARFIKYITNTDEQVVLDADYLAFYKGVPVIILPIGKEAFSYGAMFIGSNVTSKKTVRHEYGHSVHFSQIGIEAYTAAVMIPSLAGYWGGVDYNVYYSQPWEYIAEVLGDVNRQGYTYHPNTEKAARIYWLFTRTIA